MKITILNGNPDSGMSPFRTHLESLCNLLEEKHQVEHFKLIDMNIKSCTGCWTCWVKTPGQCIHDDEGEQIFRSVLNSDFYILDSPLRMGFTSALLKTITDRLIVLLHPYIEIQQGECHHKKRYTKYPDFGILYAKEKDTDDEDLKIISDIYDRFAINFHATKRYMKELTRDIKEVRDETCHI